MTENLQREDLCAVDFGKAIAALILDSMGKQPEEFDSPNELDYFRQVVEVNRLPNGIWPKIEKATGCKRQYCEDHLRILTLDDELLYLASMHRVEERRLRVIVSAPEEQQRNLLMRAIKEQLSSDDLAQLVPERKKSGKKTRATRPIHRQAASKVKSAILFLRKPNIGNLDRVASEISVLIKGPKDLDLWAKTLETLAASLRKMKGRQE
ncbi:MAG: hypothetical protein WCA79_07200 [Anaerolineales bacterium]